MFNGPEVIRVYFCYLSTRTNLEGTPIGRNATTALRENSCGDSYMLIIQPSYISDLLCIAGWWNPVGLVEEGVRAVDREQHRT